MKNIIKGIFGLITMILLSACGPDTTKELIVFEEGIGMPDSMLGTHKVVKFDDKKPEVDMSISLCYKNGKYHFAMTGGDEKNAGYHYGTFIPSGVKGKKDYFIMSFPKLKSAGYNHSNKTKGIETYKNVLVSIKKEGDTVMMWMGIFGKGLSSQSVDEVKNNVIKSYTKTFVQEPFIVAKKMSACSRNTERAIDEIDRKYKDYITEKEKDEIKKVVLKQIDYFFNSRYMGAYYLARINFGKYKFLQTDKDLFLKSAKLNANSILFFDKKLRQDKELMLKAININLFSYNYSLVDYSYFTDMFRARNQKYKTLYPDKLVAGDQYLYDLIENSPRELRNISDRLINKDLAIRAFEFGASVPYDFKFKDDYDVMKIAIKASRFNFRDASKNLKNDYNFAYSYVKKYGSGLEDLSSKLKKNKSIVKAAFISEPYSLGYADISLKKDKEFIIKLLKSYRYLPSTKYEPNLLAGVKDFFNKDREVILEAIKTHSTSIEYADNSLVNDKNFIIDAINANPYVYFHLDEKYQNDKEVTELAHRLIGNFKIKKVEYVGTLYTIDSFSNCSHENKKFFLKMIHEEGPFFMTGYKGKLRSPYSCFQKDKDIAMAIATYGLGLESIDKKFRKDKNFVIELIKTKNMWMIYENIDNSLQLDEDVLRAIE